jgi:superfamily I DNA and/or RNA helicase
VELALAEEKVDVVAGTAWLFARAPLEGAVDVLFVDEAGQMSLANVVAMGGAASSIVLLGDPNQLPMVSQGVHPEGAGASALEHVLDGATTLDVRRGLFLDETWRMHPDVNGYISTAFYAGRLDAHPSTHVQRISSPDPLVDGTGVRFVPMAHDGNASRSTQEANLVADVVAGLIGKPWTNRHGVTNPIDARDLCIVAPYNAHVAAIAKAIEARLGPSARIPVGTVDKFQGAPGRGA